MKKIYLLFLIALAFGSCSKDQLLPTTDNIMLIPLIEESSFSELSQLPVLGSQRTNSSKASKNSSELSQLEVKGNFIIKKSRILKINTQDYISYTAIIERPEKNPEFFENLVIVSKEGDAQANVFIVKYIPTKKMVLHETHQSYSFDGIREVSLLSGNVDFNTSKSFNKSSSGCFGTYEWWCSWDSPHPAGTNCKLANDGRVYLAYFPPTDCTDEPTLSGGGGRETTITDEDPVITTIMYEDGTIVENPSPIEGENIVVNQEFLNDHPCVAKVVQEAYGICSPLTSAVLAAFEANDGSNLTFSYSSNISANAETTPLFKYIASTRTCDAFITFRESYITGATDLSIARTTIHESLHATLVYMLEEGLLQNSSGTTLSGFEDLVETYINYLAGLPENLNRAHHELMSEFVGDIATSLSSFGRSKGYDLPSSHYESMAWGGLQGTSYFNVLYPKYINPSDSMNNPGNVNPEWLKIINTIAAEKDNFTITYQHPNGTTYTFNPQGQLPNSTIPCN